MDNWYWWIITCVCSLYFLILLLEFNRPNQRLMEQIDSQEVYRLEMGRRLSSTQEQITELEAKLEKFGLDMEDLEEKRKEILPEANKRQMIHVSPGPFVMGGREEDSPKNEQPAHTVYLSAYYISRFPVTNQDYHEFIQCTGHRAPIHWQRGTFPSSTGNHPVANVSWQDARDYADWRIARLPTEAEWEKAARGTDGRPYPWGTRFTEGERCNGNNLVSTTTPVDEYADGRSFYEVWDMAGNVYEWCRDSFDEQYYKHSPTTNPSGPEGGQEWVIRGGSYQETRAALRTTHRLGTSEVSTRDNIGFRLAMDVDAMRSS